MTIIDKVISLLEDGSTDLKHIYASLKGHSKASIRGNINRYIKKPNAKIRRVAKGVYSLVEVLKVEKIDDTQNKISYINTCYYNNQTVAYFHKNFITGKNIKKGIYKREENYKSYNKMINDFNSIKSVIAEGDSRTILKKLKDESFDCIITDPAYKCISGGKGSCSGILSKNDGKIFEENNIKFSEWLPDAYRVLKEGSHAYIFTNFLNLQKLMEEVQKVGFKIHNLLVWEKNNATPNRWYMKNCEYVLLCRKGKAKAINNKGSMTVSKFDNIIGNKIHETEKPIDLISYYMSNSTNENDWILDPFGGSMVLNIAGLKYNRKVFSIEKAHNYVIQGINRVKNYIISGEERNITPIINSL